MDVGCPAVVAFGTAVGWGVGTGATAGEQAARNSRDVNAAAISMPRLFRVLDTFTSCGDFDWDGGLARMLTHREITCNAWSPGNPSLGGCAPYLQVLVLPRGPAFSIAWATSSCAGIRRGRTSRWHLLTPLAILLTATTAVFCGMLVAEQTFLFLCRFGLAMVV